MAPRTPWPICETCRAIPQSLFSHHDEISQPLIHHLWPSFAAFEASALRGCHTCTLFYEAVREPFKQCLEPVPAAIYLESAVREDTQLPVVALTVDLLSLPDHASLDETLGRDEADVKSSFRFKCIADVKFVLDWNAIPTNAKHFQGLISLYTEDDGALRYIKQSLNNCLTHHDATCNRVMFPLHDPAPVKNIVHGDHGLVVAPTRLICVGSEKADDPARLVDGQECLRRGGYLVLSYCWGLTPKNAAWQLSASSSSVERFAAEIPLDILPQTLHDAVLWTRKLGERYIWIDSMCIIQDDRDDWRKEAAQMASCYGSATMTLVAASSSVYGGMTDCRNPLRNSAATLELTHGLETYTVHILPNGQKRTAPPVPPTDSRGWCYQEDVLSSRLVKITQTSILWQCMGDTENPTVRIARAQGLERLSHHPPHRWYTIWYRLVERYSCKSLTYPTDRLLAFEGIASDTAGQDCIAGFLRTDPWMSLLWCRNEHQYRLRPGHRVSGYVAPSWSWASLDAAVLFYEASSRNSRRRELDAVHLDPELHAAQVTPISSSAIGAVTAGSLELDAYMVMARSSPAHAPFLFNTRLGVHTRGRRNLALDDTIVGVVVFDVADEAADNRSLCCVLLHTADLSHWKQNGTAGLGLALEIRDAAVEPLVCTRVGYVQFTSAFGMLSLKRRLKIV